MVVVEEVLVLFGRKKKHGDAFCCGCLVWGLLEEWLLYGVVGFAPLDWRIDPRTDREECMLQR